MRACVIPLLTLAASAPAQPALFAAGGQVWTVESDGSIGAVATPGPVAELFGALADGRLVAGAGPIERGAPHEITRGLSLRLIEPGGAETVIAGDVLRAYPAPVGDDVLFITVNRDSRLWDGARVIDLGIERRASHFAWWPDGRAAALTGFDPDWTEQRQSNPDNTEEFLRMNNNDIHRLDLETGALTPLVVHPEADWAPSISPDGTQMLFNSTRLGGHAAMFVMDLATGDIRCLDEPTPGAGYGENLPVALVGQMVWTGDGRLVYATARPDESREVRIVDLDGQGAAALGDGARPQLMAAGTVAVQTDDGELAVLALPEVE